MRKPMFALLALAISLLGTQCWAQCVENCPPPSITNTFTPDVTTNTYDFSATGDGVLIVHFLKVLTPPPGFTLTVTVNHTIDAFDPKEFPADTVAVTYANNQQDQYDFTGNKLGDNGVPQKGIDYTGLIDLELGYFLSPSQIAHDPGFGHAPGPNVPTAKFLEDILRHYSSGPLFFSGEFFSGDPTMGGTLPGLSSVVAADKPLEEDDCFQWVSPTQNQVFTAGEEIEVEFQLFSRVSGGCPNTGEPLRDKDARLSLSTFINRQRVYLPIGKDEGGKNFHFDHKDGVNEREVDTEGLQPGTYFIDVTSDEFSPQTRTFRIQ